MNKQIKQITFQNYTRDNFCNIRSKMKIYIPIDVTRLNALYFTMLVVCTKNHIVKYNKRRKTKFERDI